MPRDGAIIFSDLFGKLDVLHVNCENGGVMAVTGCTVSLKSAGVRRS
jgi:hypothetical protein